MGAALIDACLWRAQFEGQYGKCKRRKKLQEKLVWTEGRRPGTRGLWVVHVSLSQSVPHMEVLIPYAADAALTSREQMEPDAALTSRKHMDPGGCEGHTETRAGFAASIAP